MIKSEYEKEVQEFKDYILETTKTIFEKDGHLLPAVVILTKQEENMKVIFIPVNEFTKDVASKNLLVKIMPSVFDKIHSEGGTPVCFSFSFEAWVRKADKDSYDPDKWQDLPVVDEVILSSFETEYSSEHVARTILREGDKATLAPPWENEFNKSTNVGGRFANLFRKYKISNSN